MKKKALHVSLVLQGRLERTESFFVLFKQAIIGAKHIHIEVKDSPGGDATVATEVVNTIEAFKRGGGYVTTHGIGKIASSSLMIYLQGDPSVRSAARNAEFVIDLPFKIIDRKILLGYDKTADMLRELLKENEQIMNARTQWAQCIAKETKLHAKTVQKLEGHLLSHVEAHALGFFTKVK